MLKLVTNHTLYKVHNVWSGTFVLIDHKPSKQELEEIRELENWVRTNGRPEPVEISVFKIDKIYTTAGALEGFAKHSRKYHKRVTKRLVKALKCDACDGLGYCPPDPAYIDCAACGGDGLMR